MKRRFWSHEEDTILREYVEEHGEKNWKLIEKNSALSRSWKSCRLRWQNHLRSGLKKSPITIEEKILLIYLRALKGNKWAQIAKHFPGRTDNELKNFCNKLGRWRKRSRETGLPTNDLFNRMLGRDEDILKSLELDDRAVQPNAVPPNASTFRGPSLYENPAAIVGHNQIHHNSDVGSKDEHILSQQDFLVYYKLLEGNLQTGLPFYPADGGSSRVSDQNHQQQIDAKQHHCYYNAQESPALAIEHSLPSGSQVSYARTGIAPIGDVFPPNISNSTAADEEQTGNSSKRQKCDRNSTCPDAVVQNYEASDRFEMESEWQSIVDYFLDGLEVDVGIITDERALPPNASTFREPSLYENHAAIAEHGEILGDSVAGSECESVPPQSDFWMHDELIEETQLRKNAYLMENSNTESDGEIDALLEYVRCNE